ncbi:MAG: hypothetical protein KGL40_07590 [Rhodocyclaceae bacterium]|nr:hypothetical protein [Rhodocyclaceae bacterium]
MANVSYLIDAGMDSIYGKLQNIIDAVKSASPGAIAQKAEQLMQLIRLSIQADVHLLR